MLEIYHIILDGLKDCKVRDWLRYCQESQVRESLFLSQLMSCRDRKT